MGKTIHWTDATGCSTRKTSITLSLPCMRRNPAGRGCAGEVVRAAGTPPKDQQSREHDRSAVKGVSLLDAALILTEEDRPLAREKKTAWQKLRTPKLPASIGNCPNHSQVKLFAPSAIADFVEEVEGKSLCTQYKLRERLRAKAREPRQE